MQTALICTACAIWLQRLPLERGLDSAAAWSDVDVSVGVALVLLVLNRFHVMRYLRAYVPVLMGGAFVYRYFHHPGSSARDSLLSSLVTALDKGQLSIEGGGAIPVYGGLSVRLPARLGFLAGDLLGVAAVYGAYTVVSYLVKHADDLSSVSAAVKIVKDAGFSVVKHLPAVQLQMAAEGAKMEAQLDCDIKVASRAIGVANRTLPAQGLSHKQILQMMRDETRKENVIWQGGKVSGAVYHGGKEHRDLLNEAFGLYSISNPLHPDIWPSGMKMESEVIQMVASFMDGRHGSSQGLNDDFYRRNEEVCGCTTSGGTESIVLAIKAHRDYYRDEKGITQPEMIACTSAHAAVNKACDMLGIKLVQVGMDESPTASYATAGGTATMGGYRMSVRATIDAINSNTILLYSSAPSYPQGVIDDIPTLSRVARHYDVGLHVDCCLGGFVLPFAKALQRDNAAPPSLSSTAAAAAAAAPVPATKSLRSRSRSRGRKAADPAPIASAPAAEGESEAAYHYGQGIPDFDFGLRGVTSMSVDTHKFGYALKGSSVVLYGNKKLRQAQYFCFADWTGGMYTTPTIAGSRSGGLIAQCWASMMAIGEEGYKAHTKDILDTTRAILRGCEGIDDIRTLGDSSAMIVCFASADEAVVNTYTVSDIMNKKFGWSLNTLQNPACVHLCCTVRHVGHVDGFVADLTAAVAEARASIARGEQAEGKAAIYGMTSGMPTGPINELLKVYNDVVLKI